MVKKGLWRGFQGLGFVGFPFQVTLSRSRFGMLGALKVLCRGNLLGGGGGGGGGGEEGGEKRKHVCCRELRK